MPTFSSQVSIIIPVLNEATLLQEALEQLMTQVEQAEVLVVDGGSTDGSLQLAQSYCRVLAAKSGRGEQCNAGVRASRGNWLLFLHADTRLPQGFLQEMKRIAQRGGQAGAFPLWIEGRHGLLPLLSWGTNWRTRWRNIVLGDQACFIRRQLFERLGGFPNLAMMEDYAFSLLVKQQGIRWHLAKKAVRTSGRRWQQEGFWRTWWLFRRLFYQFHHHPDFARMLKNYPPIR